MPTSLKISTFHCTGL